MRKSYPKMRGKGRGFCGLVIPVKYRHPRESDERHPRESGGLLRRSVVLRSNTKEIPAFAGMT
jgi:hypothetical protein